jgi:hypothetical protein
MRDLGAVSVVVTVMRDLYGRHSGAMRSIEPGISRFPDAQLRI